MEKSTGFFIKSNDESLYQSTYETFKNLDYLAKDRNEIFNSLRAENIGVNVHYIPVPWLTYYQKLGYQKESWPIAESNYQRMISLPIWPGMTNADVEDVILAVNKVLTAYRK